jgi:hypothetical protein
MEGIRDMEIIVKPDKDENPNTLYNLLRNGLGGRYVLRSTIKNKETGVVTFKFKDKSK